LEAKLCEKKGSLAFRQNVILVGFKNYVEVAVVGRKGKGK